MTNLQRWILIALFGLFVFVHAWLNRYHMEWHKVAFIRYDKFTGQVDGVTIMGPEQEK